MGRFFMRTLIIGIILLLELMVAKQTKALVIPNIPIPTLNMSFGKSDGIVTGNATAITEIKNEVNTTRVTCTSCPSTGEPTPTTPPPQITPTPTPTESAPTPTPTPPPSGGGEAGGQGGPGGGEAGGVGGAAVSVPTPQGEVLGLAVTSGSSTLAYFLQSLGALCLGYGLKLFRKNR